LNTSTQLKIVQLIVLTSDFLTFPCSVVVQLLILFSMC